MGFLKKDKKQPKKFTLYVPQEYVPIIEETKDTAVREGESLSQKFVQFCVRYNQLHGHGNPQMFMDKFSTQKKLDKNICEVDGCANKAEYLCISVFPYGKDRKLCRRHMVDEERKGNIAESKKL